MYSFTVAHQHAKKSVDGPTPRQPQGWENWVSRGSNQRRAKVPGCVDGLGWGIFPA